MKCVKGILFFAVFSVLLGCMDQKSSEVKAEFDEPTELNPTRAAEILGITPPSSASATTGRCARCHGDFKTFAGIDNLYNQTWGAYQCFQGNTTSNTGKLQSLACLARLSKDLSDSDREAVDNLDASAISKGIRGLSPSDLGFFTAAVGLDSFRKIFTGNGDTFLPLLDEAWLKSASMPKNGAALSANDFQIALNWLINLSPGKEKFLTHDGPNVCTSETETSIGNGIRSHVQNMSNEGEGWMAKNQANGLKMFGCDSTGCFNAKGSSGDIFPLVNGILKTTGEVRNLYTLDGERSTYWTRSSADGRYVSYGSTPYSIIVDLQPKLSGQAARRIQVEADYDPAFTPDNLSFIFQGEEHGTRLCNQSMLQNPNLRRIDFRSEDCSASNLEVGLYQGIGRSLDNGDIMTVHGGFKGDEGSDIVQDTPPLFLESATIDISIIRQSDSSAFEKVSTQSITTPHMANWMLSPSQKFVIGTVSAATSTGKARHGGFHLVLTDSLVSNKSVGSGDDAGAARLCVASGEKPQVSFDERYLVYYAYEQHPSSVSPSESSANLFVIDLLGDGKPVQLTNLPKGTYAQFPHFRSDGWLYFNLYNTRTEVRSVLATDAILKLAK